MVHDCLDQYRPRMVSHAIQLRTTRRWIIDLKHIDSRPLSDGDEIGRMKSANGLSVVEEFVSPCLTSARMPFHALRFDSKIVSHPCTWIEAESGWINWPPAT